MNRYLHAATGSIILTGVLTAACYSPVALSANDQDDQQLPLPNLAECVNTEPPMLPAKWEATALRYKTIKWTPILNYKMDTHFKCSKCNTVHSNRFRICR